MYNPSRGGVRGGADQFTWESVKTDKHRENYLGHSLKAPVGRWQKGKDLSWYAKERKDTEDTKISDRSELAAIKRAEQEAMLIALGHNVIRKENQSLTKEEMVEALKRNVGDRDQLNIERVDGVGSKSGRAALLTGTRSKNEGVTFETHKDRAVINENSQEELSSIKRSKNKKKSKKHKKEKKREKKNQNKYDSDDSESELPTRKEYSNDRTKKGHNTDESGNESSYKERYNKEKEIKKRHDSSDSEKYQGQSSSKREHRNEETKKRHYIEEFIDSEDDTTFKHKQKKEKKKRHNTSDSDRTSYSDFSKSHRNDKLYKKHFNISYDKSDNFKSTKEHKVYKRESDFNSLKHKKKSKYSSDDSKNEYQENWKDNHKGQELVKRRRHDTSESD